MSLTAVVCKVMESIIRDNLTNHLDKKPLLSEHQHGFTKRRSCITHKETMEMWTSTLDEAGNIDAIYLDFMKAFDKVPHCRLLSKLEAYNITGKLHSWLKEFLTGRKQHIAVLGAVSSRSDVSSGIPQGSVLGPFLFILFINDMPEVVSCAIKLFADDTKIFTQVTPNADCTNLQRNLNKLEDWTNTWQMAFNPYKCKVLRLGKNHPPPPTHTHTDSTTSYLDPTTHKWY